MFISQLYFWDCIDIATEDNNFPKIQALLWEKKVTKSFLIMLGLFLASYIQSCVFVYIVNLCNICSNNIIQWSRDASTHSFMRRKAFVALLRCGIGCHGMRSVVMNKLFVFMRHQPNLAVHMHCNEISPKPTWKLFIRSYSSSFLDSHFLMF